MEMRMFNHPDLDLFKLAEVFYSLFLEDKINFVSDFPGLDDPFAGDFRAAIDNASAIADDYSMIASVGVAIESLKTEMDLASRAIYRFYSYISVAFDGNRATLKSFGKADLQAARNSYTKMIDLLDRVWRQAELPEQKAALISAGYSQAEIDGLQTIRGDLMQLVAAKDDAKSERLRLTSERIAALNNVWKYMQKISTASRVVFYNNPAKLHQYRLNMGKKPKKKEKVVGVETTEV